MYSKTQIKNLISLNYKDNKLLLYKFLISNKKIVLKNNFGIMWFEHMTFCPQSRHAVCYVFTSGA
jgi:hypothetical protein